MLGRGVGGMVAKPVVVGEFQGPNMFSRTSLVVAGDSGKAERSLSQEVKADAFPGHWYGVAYQWFEEACCTVL